MEPWTEGRTGGGGREGGRETFCSEAGSREWLRARAGDGGGKRGRRDDGGGGRTEGWDERQ